MDATLLSLLEHRNPRVILVLGASDTGKTTLIEQLLSAWDPGEPIAVVDCDVGQSHLGPPTTIGWSLITKPFTGWHGVAVRGVAFIGAVSPEGDLEGFLQATGQIVKQARQAASRFIVDTTGLVNGELGMTLKRRKIELVNPDLIFAIQRDRELEELLAHIDQRPIERVPASSLCVRRSLAERAAYRDRQFARYFANSTTQRLLLNQVKLIGLGPDWRTGEVVLSPAALIDRVVGLRNAQGEDLALGLLRELDLTTQTLAVFTPLRDVSAVTTVAIGSIQWPSPVTGLEGP